MGAELFRESISYFTVLRYIFGIFFNCCFLQLVFALLLEFDGAWRLKMAWSWLGNKLEGLGEGEAPAKCL